MVSRGWWWGLWPWAHAGVLVPFVRREVAARYRGTLGGWLWAVGQPLAMLAVYTLVFREVFNARWPQAAQGDALDFALRVFGGLLVFQLWADVLTRAPAVVVQQPSLVKKVVFPLEVLPWVVVGSALVQAAAAAGVWLAVAALTGRLGGGAEGSLAWVLAPLWLVFSLPFLLGVGWLLGALGVFVRDVGQGVGAVVSLLMFVSPVFYPLALLPPAWQGWAALNPLALPMEQLRGCVLDGVWPSAEVWQAAGVYALVGLVMAVLGLRWFVWLKRGFADVV